MSDDSHTPQGASDGLSPENKPKDNQVDDLLAKYDLSSMRIPARAEFKAALATAIREVLKDETTTVEEGRTYDMDELMAIVRPSKERNDLREEIREALRGIGLEI